jgi:putative DNA primase/helicase
MSAAERENELDEIRAALTDRIETLAELLLGPRNLKASTRDSWRWGRKGSFALVVNGRKRGGWKDHESGDKGSPFDLITRVNGGSFADAVAWARAWLGWPERNGHADGRRFETQQREQERARKHAEAEAEQAADEAKRIASARRLWAASTPLDGTVAERYLTTTRGIPTPAEGWPDNTRFHADTRALIVAATTADGSVQAVQRVHLTGDARKAEATEGRPTKRTNGLLAGAAVRLPGPADGPLLIAEGIENGLTGWVATRYETWCMLGAVAGAMPPVGRVVIVISDGDPPGSPADRLRRTTIREWQARGIDVRVATPQ